MPTLIIVLIVSALIVWVIYNRIKKPFDVSEAKLIKRCYGDESQAERLIKYELNKDPSLSRSEAVERAFESILRDNR